MGIGASARAPKPATEVRAEPSSAAPVPAPAAANAERFVAAVDSAVVLVNASTMFCDGESLGMGAEIGISTDKLHARGPMGLEELTSYKFVIRGSSHVMGAWSLPED